MAYKHIILPVVVVAMMACSNSSGTDNSADADTIPRNTDMSADVSTVPFDIPPRKIDPDLDAADDAEAPAPDLPPTDSGPDLLTPACQPGEGCFLDKCDENAQCQSGWCVEHMGEGVCSQSCVDECPQGWTCKQVGASDPDVVYICVPNFSNLCKPCLSTEGCQAAGGAQDVCVAYGDDGSFCGGTCTEDSHCPWGFSCLTTVTVDGIDTLQCVADAGACPCTAKSVSLSLWTNCQVTGEFGTCTGKRVCTEEGLTDCDALLPAVETCNGIDDDCDDFTDEPDEVQGDFVNLCDDGNDCTDDNCNGEAGCEHIALDDGECLDGDPCTVADHCVAGECTGNPVLCDDDEPCTDDSCDGSGGCLFQNNANKCDDADPCTVADQCDAGLCSGTIVPCDCQQNPDCDALEDQDLCNGTLYCTLDDWPYKCAIDPDSVVECPEPEPGLDAICSKASCDPDDGACSIVPDHEGYPCEDGSVCTIGDVCTQGVCTPGIHQQICNDGNPCTADSCDPVLGCQGVPNEESCTDNNVCTTGDSCVAGSCAGGPELECDDGNICTEDQCDPDVGCLHPPVIKSVCDDNNACTVNEHCKDGFCAPGNPIVCDDGNPCSDDTCHPEAGCLYVLNTNPCDDGNICTLQDECVWGNCVSEVSLDCADNNPCTDDSCDPALGCIFPANDDPCDDANACTTGDHCAEGICVSTGSEGCDDDNPCTDDSCEPTVGCIHELNTVPCDDGDACTTNDACDGGVCGGGPAINCIDEDPCTDDACLPDSGCVYTHNSGPCDNGNNCTEGDTCSNGECLPGQVLECDDFNPCTSDACEPGKGCVFATNFKPCDDGNECTVNDVCSQGQCTAGAPRDCDDDNVCTDDNCNAATGCVYSNNEKSCDDDSQCTLVDSCVDGTCIGTGALTCNDSNPCTDDTCEAAQGCLFSPNSKPCNDSDGCTLQDTCVQGSCVGTACSDIGMYCVGGVCKDSPCEGHEFGGYCWYSGGVGSSCSSICSGHGGCAAQGLQDYAGSKGCEPCQDINPGKSCKQHGDCNCAAVYPGLYTSGSQWCGYNSQNCTSCSSAKQCGNYSVIRYCPCLN